MINKEMRQFPIKYTGPVGSTAIGWGVHTTVADECKKANIKKALITTTGLKGTGIVDEIEGILEYNGVATEIYSKVTSNPKDYQVMEAYQIFKEGGCDGVVSVGGGSSHDCGKGVRLVACNDGQDIRNLFAGSSWAAAMQKNKPVTIPQVSVNTTAGTSAESQRLGMVTDSKLLKKEVAIGQGVSPTMALIDPLLVRLMPQNVAAWTGWDAFAHAFEVYIANVHLLPEIAALCLKVAQLVAENLREFAYNRMNDIACENMCYAESMSRIILGGGGSPGGFIFLHEIATQIGGITDSHHGRSIAVLTLPTQRYNEATVPERFGEMAQAMGVDTRGLTRIQAADMWFDEVERLLSDLHIKTGHLNEQLGLEKKHLREVAIRTAKGSMVPTGAPEGLVADEIVKILEEAL